MLAGRSETRNKAIARVFKELDYIEQWGSGIKRIFSWCEEAGVAKPLITEKGDFVDVELYREYTSVKESVQDDVGKILDVRESVQDIKRVQEKVSEVNLGIRNKSIH
ncbi:MAG: ATP-binding protein [Butyricimonas faecihominis]